MWDEQWLKQFPVTTYEAGKKIIAMGEPVQYNYYLIEGTCARIEMNSLGDDIIQNYYHSGKMLGINLLRYDKKSINDFIAKTKCICYQIPCLAVQQMVQNNVKICYSILQETLDELDYHVNASNAFIFGGGISSLCLHLKRLAELQPDGTYLIPHYITNIELSKYCGIHTVSISRLLTKLLKEKIISRNQDGIVIHDIDALTGYIILE